ncbi:MAG: hypothetical protein HY056_10085 [Proteobacteria bacterium]|nr:hypothetical protein [Pseudomonadota bacterium]
MANDSVLSSSALRLLARLSRTGGGEWHLDGAHKDALAALISAGLVEAATGQMPYVTQAGHAHLARRANGRSVVGPFRAQHASLVRRRIDTPLGPENVTVNEAESPLVWLARRRSRDGRSLIEPVQLLAGERLRGDFTRAALMPQTTSRLDATPGGRARRAPNAGAQLAEVVVDARLRVRRALDAAGPEFSGILLDICCFLKGLEDVERERNWPARSAKIVLALALDRLARHYGLSSQTRGNAHGRLRSWAVADAPQPADAGVPSDRAPAASEIIGAQQA